jgi:hypothetical protein
VYNFIKWLFIINRQGAILIVYTCGKIFFVLLFAVIYLMPVDICGMEIQYEYDHVRDKKVPVRFIARLDMSNNEFRFLCKGNFMARCEVLDLSACVQLTNLYPVKYLSRLRELRLNGIIELKIVKKIFKNCKALQRILIGDVILDRHIINTNEQVPACVELLNMPREAWGDDSDTSYDMRNMMFMQKKKAACCVQ